MNNLKRLSATYLLGLTLCTSAFAADMAMEVGLLGGITVGMGNSYTVSGLNASTSTLVKPAVGAFFHYSLMPEWGLQLGVHYQAAGVSLNANQTTVTVGNTILNQDVWVNTIHIPLLVTWTAVPEYLRIGVGGFFALAAQTDLNTQNAGSTSVSYTLASQSMGTTGWGLTGDVMGMYPVASNLNVLLDVRYNWGLTNWKTNADSVKFSDLDLFAGVSYKF